MTTGTAADAGRPAVSMVVFGDSVVWGQGLKHDDTFIVRLRDHLSDRYDVAVHSYAHSGAVIGSWQPALDVTDEPASPTSGESATWAAGTGEVPWPTPSIHQQLTTAARDVGAKGADLVILDGGINDIDSMKIVLPATPFLDGYSVATITELAKTYCDDAMGTLLARIRTTFPNARVLVVGYYPIVTEASHPFAIGLMFARIEPRKLLGEVAALIPRAVRRMVGRQTGAISLKAHTVAQCRAFAEQSDIGLRAAAARTGASFVSPNFGYQHPIFSGAGAYLWGWKWWRPADEQVRTREAALRAWWRHHPEQFVGRFFDARASMFHPNVVGAQHYLNALAPVVDPLVDALVTARPEPLVATRPERGDQEPAR